MADSDTNKSCWVKVTAEVTIGGRHLKAGTRLLVDWDREPGDDDLAVASLQGEHFVATGVPEVCDSVGRVAMIGQEVGNA